MSLTKSQFFNEINGLDTMFEQEIYERQAERLQEEQEAIESGKKLVIVAKIKPSKEEPFLPF